MDTFYNDVNDWLLVGADLMIAEHLIGWEESETIAHLMGRGVTHVLDARVEWSDAPVWRDNGLPAENYAHLPIVDSHDHRPDEWWFTGVENFVADFLVNRSEGDKLYVHCHMGVNRGPSAAMLALLTSDPKMHPWDAFLTIREARPIAGLVYAEQVGLRHIVQSIGGSDEVVFAMMGDFRKQMRDYWTRSVVNHVNRGIAYYRGKLGDTIRV